MLESDPEKRISALDALLHPYFDDNSEKQAIIVESNTEAITSNNMSKL